MRQMLILAALTALANPAAGQEICADLATALADDGAAESVPNLFPNATCTQSRDLSGATSDNCFWAFDYRAGDAKAKFDEMLTTLSACDSSAAVVGRDQAVNHPDFYDLRLIELAGGTLGLSLKDKAARQQTLVFLRVTPRP